MARPTPPPRELTYVPLARLSDDTSFRIRPGGDISSLARSIAQAGQLFPIEVRPSGDGFQAITGFRRLAALRILHRDRVLVRVHGGITDAAAATIAAADALDNRPVEKEELLELRERYLAMGWSTPALEELIGRAIEKAEERLEDLAAQLGGLPPPDRSIEDEDALDDEEIHGSLPDARRQNQAQVSNEALGRAENQAQAVSGAQTAPLAVESLSARNGTLPEPQRQDSTGTSAVSQGQRQPNGPVEPPADPPGPIALGSPRNAPIEISAHGAATMPGMQQSAGTGAGATGSATRETTPAGLADSATRETTPAGWADSATRETTPSGLADSTTREMTPAALAEDLAQRLSLLTQDLATIADAWSEVPAALRGIVADQINYYRQLGAWMDQASGDEQ